MKLLLHVCCGPCSIYPAEYLKNENINFEGYFFNPNIHPIEEFERRKTNSIIAADKKGFILHHSDDFKQDVWENFTNTSGNRCHMCYDTRLCETANFAASHNFDAFTTSLLVSPYQNHELLKQLGEYYASKFSIKFYYADFRTGFRKGQNEARDMALYRQKYCGCIKSLTDNTVVKTKLK